MLRLIEEGPTTMSDLVPCPVCDRHVRKHESACPFCAAKLSLAHLPPPVLPRNRLGRAATFAFGATLVGASLVACGGDSEEGKKDGGGGAGAGGGSGAGSGGQAGSTMGGNATAGSAMGGNATAGNAMGGNATAGSAMGGNAMGGNIAQPYGVPPMGGAGFGNVSGSGGQGAGAGGQSTAGTSGQGQSGDGPVPAYGAPPPQGGGTPVYGAAPAD
jgi:hypothetical protein